LFLGESWSPAFCLCDLGSCVRRSTELSERNRRQRAAYRLVDEAGMRLDEAVAVERAIVASLIHAGGHCDRAFDGLDDVGQADAVRVAREREPARGAARRLEQAGGGEAAGELLRGGSGTPVSCARLVADRRVAGAWRAAAAIITTA
jgi:hypothetical protein